MWMTREEIAVFLGIVPNSVRGKVQKGQIERKVEEGKKPIQARRRGGSHPSSRVPSSRLHHPLHPRRNRFRRQKSPRLIALGRSTPSKCCWSSLLL